MDRDGRLYNERFSFNWLHPSFVKVFCLVLFFATSSAFRLSKCEKDSLKLLFDSCGGYNWNWNQGSGIAWNFTDPMSDPCHSKWQGVLCKYNSFMLDENVYNNSILELSLKQHNLNGFLHADIFNCSQSIEKLDLSFNFISQSIPDSLGLLIGLKHLNLYANKFSGSIPSSFSNLLNLTYFDLAKNALTNRIPSFLCNISHLQRLNLYGNELSSSIPSCVSELTELTYLSFGQNSLVGVLPNICNMFSLTSVNFGLNRLTGQIDPCIANITVLEYIGFHDNRLTGPLPPLANHPNMWAMDLHKNSFSHSIPSSFCNLHRLIYMSLFRNSLQGTIPSCIGGLSLLKELLLDTNRLTGTLPSELGKLNGLLEMWVLSNQLSGTIPSTFNNLTSLNILFLYNNSFTGTFPALQLPVKETIDISSNLFSGILPDSMLSGPMLKTFVASDNCLSTKISDAICNSTSLKWLILNGVNRNARCPSNTIERNVAETLPSCLWSISTLEKLYLSGNGFRGTMSTFELFNLKALNLNSNRIRGVLSSNFTGRTFEVFDIANNQITGAIDMNVSSPEGSQTLTAFSTKVNRLSGAVCNKAIETFDKVSVLSGNRISCQTLPMNDKDIGAYNCETKNLKSTIIIWCSFFAASIFLFLVYWYKEGRDVLSLWFQTIRTEFHRDVVKNKVRNAVQLLISLRKMTELSIALSFFIAFSTVMIYSWFEFNENADRDYKTHKFKYSYIFSGIFLRSEASAMTLMFLYLFVSSVLLFGLFNIFVTNLNTISKSNAPETDSQSHQALSPVFVRYPLMCLHIMICLACNIAYIIGLYEKVDSLRLQILYSIFVPFYFYSGTRWLMNNHFSRAGSHSIESAVVYSLMAAINDIVAPFIATIFVDPLCFDYYINHQEQISSEHSLKLCSANDTVTGACYVYDEFKFSAVFYPPFIYSQQCRNAVFGNYIPIVLMTCTCSSFLLPIFYFYSIRKVQSWSSELHIFGFTFRFRSTDLIFFDDHLFFLHSIIETIILMVLFGIVFPICSIALGVDAVIRSCIFAHGIYVYAKLQMDDSDNVSREYQDLNKLCYNIKKNATFLFWPSLYFSAIVFSLYLFDMASDTDIKSQMPVTVCVLTNTFIFVSSAIFFHRKRESDKKHKALSSLLDQQCTEITQVHLSNRENLCRSDSSTLNPLSSPVIPAFINH